MSIKNLLYKTLDAVSFQKGFACRVNGFKVYFPAKWFRYFESDYEKENILFLKEQIKPGMTVIDIGAHLGLLSAICAQLTGKTGRVYCFEPTPSTFAVLEEVIRLNAAQQIIFPQNKAVSNFNGQLDFFIDENEGSNANSLVSRNDKKRSSRKMDVVTLDDFVSTQGLEKLDLVKIDAEGSELDVLKGARKSLEKFRPRVILALHPPLILNNAQSLEAIYDLLVELNYDVFFKSRLLLKKDFCAIEDLFDVHLLPKKSFMSLLFSIVIPTYNRAHLLPATIATVLNQDYKNFELLIVDDGSTDNTADVVKGIIVNSVAHIRYIYQVNSERSVARNNGLKQASGDYVLFFDSDDALYPNHLQVASDYILSHNTPEFLHLRYDLKNGQGQIIDEGPVFQDFPNLKLINGNFLSCNGVFVRKDIALANQFNEDRKLSAMEDWELWLRLSASYPLHYINTITSSIINHHDRSVVMIKEESLKGSAHSIIQYVISNQKVMDYFKEDIHKFKASCYSYVSLHLALTGKYKKESLRYLMLALRQRPAFVFQRRFLAIIKHLL